MTVADVRAFLLSARQSLVECHGLAISHVQTPCQESLNMIGPLITDTEAALSANVVDAITLYPDIETRILNVRDVVDSIHSCMASVYEPLEKAYTNIVQAIGNERAIDAQMDIALANEKLGNIGSYTVLGSSACVDATVVAHTLATERLQMAEAQVSRAFSLAQDVVKDLIRAIENLDTYMGAL